MTASKAPQQTSNTSIQQSLEEETTFIDLLAIIVKKKSLILFTTSIGTFLSFSYYFLATPIYQAKISFLPPFQELYLSQIPTNLLTQKIGTNLEIKEDKSIHNSANVWINLNSKDFLYHQFLTKIQSFTLQKEVLNNKYFIEGFLGDSHRPENLNQKFINLHNKISLKISSIDRFSKKTIALNIPAHLEMTGPNPVVLAEFLNTLAASAKATTISETQNALQTLIDSQLKFTNAEIDKQLKFIKTEARLKHKVKLRLFSDSLKIAQNLNIKNNNFHLLDEIFPNWNGASLIREEGKINIPTSESKGELEKGIIPHWFLYGEKALIEELKILNSKTNQFSNIKNGDSDLLEINNVIYSEKFADLEFRIKQLQSLDVKSLLPNIVSIDQPSIPPSKPINIKVGKVFSTGVGLGLLFGTIAAFISHAIGIVRDKNN
jgi:LPS O-antigen subunit length determinant protein (WzzB/FepE family)